MIINIMFNRIFGNFTHYYLIGLFLIIVQINRIISVEKLLKL